MDNYLVSPQFFLYLQYTRKVSRKIMLFLQRNSWKHRSTKTNSRQMDKSQVKKTKINITCENGVTISCGRYWMNVGYMKKPRLCILISPLFFAAFVLENTTRRENEIGVRRERMADRIVLSLLIITIVAGVCWEQSAAWWLSQLYSLSKMTLRSRPRSRHVSCQPLPWLTRCTYGWPLITLKSLTAAGALTLFVLQRSGQSNGMKSKARPKSLAMAVKPLILWYMAGVTDRQSVWNKMSVLVFFTATAFNLWI